MASTDEFHSFCDKKTDLFVITLDGPEGLPAGGRELRKKWRELQQWIKKKCSNLLRSIGRPAKLEPFTIDTGDHESIKIKPRPHSPLDLTKIKEFIDENMENGIIEETDSP